MPRSIYCYGCKEIKENPKLTHCYKCKRERDNEWRIRTGRTKKHRTGKCACGGEIVSYSYCYCLECLRKRQRKRTYTPEQLARIYERNRQYRAKKRGEKKLKQDPVNVKRRERYKNLEYAEMKFKHQVRALTRAYIAQGKLIKQLCEVCDEAKTEAHHDDYTKPLHIRWLCLKHHREHHKKE